MDETIVRLKTKYIELFGEEGCVKGTIDAIQTALGVTLPSDVVGIASFYRGGIVGGISHHAFATTGPADNVVDETLRLRETINLPVRFVVIAEPPNSLIVLDTSSQANDPAVIWCDAQDVEGLESPNSLKSPDTWWRYMDFFSHLIDEEEDERE